MPVKNYFYELMKKKYHTSEVVRAQIARIKEEIKNTVVREPLRSFTVKFKGQIVDCYFEKTLKIISRRIFIKGKVNAIRLLREQETVEANITSTLTEVESLIHYLMKPHIVLHCKKEIASEASNLLIIDASEQEQLDNFMPDYIRQNHVTYAVACEKYTGRLGDYLILNGLPLTSEKIGSELRFNKIETKNRVFTTTGLREIYLNLYFIFLLLKLDLEQHYLKLRIFESQESDLKKVEERIDDLSPMSDFLNCITSPDNPLLFNKELFFDLMKFKHIIENDNWKALPGYEGYIYSAADKLNGQFALLEEFSLFLTYATCIEKFIEKLDKKLVRHRPDIHGELENLTANYSELKKLNAINNHPILQADYHEMLNSFNKLLAYLHFLTTTIQKKEAEEATPPGNTLQGIGTTIKKYIESIFSINIEISISKKSSLPQDQMPQMEQEGDIQRLLHRLDENIKKITGMKTSTGNNVFLETRRQMPYLVNLSDILNQLKKLIKDIEKKERVEDPLTPVFGRFDKFKTLYREINNLKILKTEQDHENVTALLTDLQRLLAEKPLKESSYPEIIHKIHTLEDFIVNKKEGEKNTASHVIAMVLNQIPVFRTITDIKEGLQNILEKERHIQEIDTFQDKGGFFCYSPKELEDYAAQIVQFYEKLRDVCYYNNVSEFETLERRFDELIEEVRGIDRQLSTHTRSKEKMICREPEIHIDFLKGAQVNRYNLEKAIFFLQNQISQIEGFMHDIEGNLYQQSFVYSGVATSVLFDQITYLLSNIDVRIIELTDSAENMFRKSADTIFHYQTGESFKEPSAEDIDGLLKEIDKRMVIREYYEETESGMERARL